METFLESYRRKTAPTETALPSDENGTQKRRTSQTVRSLHADNWQEFFQQLDRITPDVFGSRECDEFIKWGPRVARCSFQTARHILKDLRNRTALGQDVLLERLPFQEQLSVTDKQRQTQRQSSFPARH